MDLKSHDKLATALRAMGHKVSSSTIPKLLEELKYCRHSNRKTKEAVQTSLIATPVRIYQREGRGVQAAGESP